MKHITIATLILILSSIVVWPKAAGIGIPSIHKADIIAHIKITSDTGNDHPHESANFATATVITPVKGCVAGDTIRIHHNNGHICFNTIYQKDDVSLVFLVQSKIDEAYVTMNHYTGRFHMKNSHVHYFHMAPGRNEWLSLDTVINFITEQPAPNIANEQYPKSY